MESQKGEDKRWRRSDREKVRREKMATGEMKSCTPLWREARWEVKSVKTPHARSTFGS